MTQDEIVEITRQAGGFDATPKFLETFSKLVAQIERNATLEEVAREFDKMKAFGDTAASFAVFVRGMKK
jgi:hypothetical protein